LTIPPPSLFCARRSARYKKFRRSLCPKPMTENEEAEVRIGPSNHSIGTRYWRSGTIGVSLDDPASSQCFDPSVTRMSVAAGSCSLRSDRLSSLQLASLTTFAHSAAGWAASTGSTMLSPCWSRKNVCSPRPCADEFLRERRDRSAPLPKLNCIPRPTLRPNSCIRNLAAGIF
jgi:hypothetical protein